MNDKFYLYIQLNSIDKGTMNDYLLKVYRIPQDMDKFIILTIY